LINKGSIKVLNNIFDKKMLMVTVVVQTSKTGVKTPLGYSYTDKILTKIFCLKS